MFVNSNKKSKIDLSNYNYKRDIENRILLSEFSVFEVNVLNEILNNSIQIRLPTLANGLNTTLEHLMVALKKLSQTRLFKIEKDLLTVDKEIRKYFECKMEMFDDDFKPGIDYLQAILCKVPIHFLPNWYAIPRSSDHIFHSIIEKYLLTPKIYEHYLSELIFDEPVLNHIVNDVFNAPDFTMTSRDICEKYDLAPEQFQEYMLLLEFSLVCCLSYVRRDEMWHEVVTPFYEWREHLRFQRDTMMVGIVGKQTIKRNHPNDFGFIEDLSGLLKAAAQVPLSLTKEGELEADARLSWLPGRSAQYAKDVIGLLEYLNLAILGKTQLKPTEYSKDWLKKSVQDKAIILYRHSIPYYLSKLCGGMDERDIRECERSVKRAISKGWIYFEDFLRGFVSPIGNVEAIMLKNKGKRWKYVNPGYTSKELHLIEMTIMERLFHAGMIARGEHEGKACFYVTPFGAMALGE